MAAPLPIGRQVILVAGATTPGGAAIARDAAAAGARVMLVGAGEGALGEAVRAINNAGGISDYAIAPDGHGKALAAAGRVARARFGRIDTWIAADGDDAALTASRTAAAALLAREGGTLLLVAPPGRKAAIAEDVPGVAVSVVTAADTDPAAVAAAVLRCASRPTGAVTVHPEGFPRRHRGLIGALGVGGVALAAGVFALWRRRGRRVG